MSVKTPEGKRLFGLLRIAWESNIKIHKKNRVWDLLNWLPTADQTWHSYVKQKYFKE
jgi:hypothetical protein